MKLVTQIWLLIIFALASVVYTFAQSSPVILPGPAPKKEIGKVTVYGDDTGTVAYSHFLNRGDKQEMQAQYNLSAKQFGENPKVIQISYFSHSESGFIYEKNRKFAVVLEGKTILQDEAKHLVKFCDKKQKNKCYEQLIALISFADFEAMMKAEKVEIQFGNTVFELTTDEKGELRNLQKTLDK